MYSQSLAWPADPPNLQSKHTYAQVHMEHNLDYTYATQHVRQKVIVVRCMSINVAYGL